MGAAGIARDEELDRVAERPAISAASTASSGFPIFARRSHRRRQAAARRPSKCTANWLRASFHFQIGRVQRCWARTSARYKSLVAASSLGKCPRLLMILRSEKFKDSIALVEKKRVKSKDATAGASRPILKRPDPTPQIQLHGIPDTSGTDETGL